MSALAKTFDDFYPDQGESSPQSPTLISSNRILINPSSDLTALSLTATALENDPSLVQITKPQLLPQRNVTFQRTFRLLQQWEGKVESCDDDTFVAIISDKKGINPDEEVEIFLSEIDKDDVRFVRPGAWFYWSVGYEEGLGIPTRRVSQFRFRRIPGITSRDIMRAKSSALKWNDLFA